MLGCSFFHILFLSLNQLTAARKTCKNQASQQTFGTSYFVTALECKYILWEHISLLENTFSYRELICFLKPFRYVFTTYLVISFIYEFGIGNWNHCWKTNLLQTLIQLIPRNVNFAGHKSTTNLKSAEQSHLYSSKALTPKARDFSAWLGCTPNW